MMHLVPQRRASTGAASALGVMLFTSALLLLLLLVATTTAREIQATKEWTLLGENDTVAAGMHVRMDLQTGEKWVKLIDDDDDDSLDDSTKPSESATESAAQVTTQGGIVVLPRRHGETAPTSDSKKDATTGSTTTSTQQQRTQQQSSPPHHDFDMMHRTLSKLPDDEKEQMLLPDLPGGTTASLTPDERRAFEERMSTIWKKRQEQLREFEQEFVADMPEILKDRIQRIQMYLQHPVQQLNEMKSLFQGSDVDGEDTDATDKGDSYVTHIVSVLKDLEYHLSDLDMTRDFITLGGWPLLVSLLSDEVHTSSSTMVVAQNNDTVAAATPAIWTDDLWEMVYSVQAHAAWAVGTAVKNTGEFEPYALVPVQIVGPLSPFSSITTTTTTTPLDLLLMQYAEITTSSIESAAARNKNHKLLYALGSLLRGNRPAQLHFCEAGGPAVLATRLTDALEQSVLSPSSSTGSVRKTIQRLLSLADDIVSDVKFHAGTSKEVDALIVQGFSSGAWCSSVLAALKVSNSSSAVQEKALHTLRTLASDCTWDDKAAVISAVDQVGAAWQANVEDRDPDVQRELLAAVESTKALL